MKKTNTTSVGDRIDRAFRLGTPIDRAVAKAVCEAVPALPSKRRVKRKHTQTSTARRTGKFRAA
ncbi:MAG TPA: hypothetical protein VG711_11620 [Phycisphaerales bacterium]|nr:hypothetical protein [Phycisphaerales bacterium]